MYKYVPLILIFVGVVGIAVGIALYFTQAPSKPKTTPLVAFSNPHVCVTQMKQQIKSLPTSSHKDFCQAIKKGLPSACSDLEIIMADENGDNTVSFTYSNGSYYPSGNLNCNLQGTDILMFKTVEVGHTDVGITEIILS